MEKALGLVEVIGLSNALEVADAMAKGANIELENIEITKGAGMVTVKVCGDVGAVNAAVAVGKAVAIEYRVLVSAHVIARPLASTRNCFTKKTKGWQEDVLKSTWPAPAIEIEKMEVEESKEIEEIRATEEPEERDVVKAEVVPASEEPIVKLKTTTILKPVVEKEAPGNTKGKSIINHKPGEIVENITKASYEKKNGERKNGGNPNGKNTNIAAKADQQAVPKVASKAAPKVNAKTNAKGKKKPRK